MDEKQQKFNATTWLIVPNVLLSLSIGFIGVMLFQKAYEQIKAVENEDIYFLTFKASLLFSFLGGAFVKRITKRHHDWLIYLEIGSVAILSLMAILVKNFSSGVIQVDYIFHTYSFYLFTTVLSFSFGIFIADLRNFRLWSFLIGIVSYLLYYYIGTELPSKPESYIVSFLVLLTIELALISILSRFKPITFYKHEQNIHPLTHIFFYSGVSFFIYHILISYFKINTNLDLILFGFAPGLLIGNIIYAYGLLRHKIRIKYVIGTLSIILNLILSLNQNNLENVYPYLFLIDLILISIYRPYNISYIKMSIYLTLGFSLFLLTHTSNLPYSLHYVAVAGFTLVAVHAVLLAKDIKKINRAIFASVAMIVSIYSYSPMPSDYDIVFYEQEELSPIPFEFIGISLNDKDFIYYNTALPFKKSAKLPKISSFKDKVIVIGLKGNSELILSYIEELRKSKFPFLVFQSKSYPVVGNEKKLLVKEYPTFRLYYSSNFKPTDIKEIRKSNKDLELVETKLQSVKSPQKAAEVLSEVNKNSNSIKGVEEYKNLFLNSFKKYLIYYYKNDLFNYSISIANIYLQFGELDSELAGMTYNSILKVTPEQNHLPVLYKLVAMEPYKEQSIKRLYPLLLLHKKHKESIQYIDSLISYYLSQNNLEEVNNLKIEKAKILLQNSVLGEVNNLVKAELKKDPNSIPWKKIQDSLNYKLQELKRSGSYYYYMFSGSPMDPQEPSKENLELDTKETVPTTEESSP